MSRKKQPEVKNSPHPVDIHVGRQLRLRRTLLGLSQEALGRAAGITFQQIQKYERGVNRIGSSRLYEFSRVLNTSVSYFFEGYEGEEKKETVQAVSAYGLAEDSAAFEYEQLNSRETLEMVRAYYKIRDPLIRRRVAEMIKAISGDEPLTFSEVS